LVQLEKEGRKNRNQRGRRSRKPWVVGGEKLVKSLPKTTENSRYEPNLFSSCSLDLRTKKEEEDLKNLTWDF
jgi:hypothetical protein